MPRGEWSTISVRNVLIEKAHKVFEKKKKEPSLTFTNWLNKLLWEALEEQEELARYAPALEYIGISESDNTIIIKDHFEDRIVEVEPHNEGIGKRFLYCRYCNRDDCLHVGFCFAIREINKMLIEKGYRKPKL